jgi:hypothetical protein
MDLGLHYGKVVIGGDFDLLVSFLCFFGGVYGDALLDRYILFLQKFLGLVFVQIHT